MNERCADIVNDPYANERQKFELSEWTVFMNEKKKKKIKICNNIGRLRMAQKSLSIKSWVCTKSKFMQMWMVLAGVVYANYLNVSFDFKLNTRMDTV